MHAGVRFAPHIDGVKYGAPVADIKRDEGGAHIPGQDNPRQVTFCANDQTKICPADEKDIAEINSGAGLKAFTGRDTILSITVTTTRLI